MKDKIKKLKEDKDSLSNYIKCFLNGKKTKEKLSYNEEYNILKDKISNNRF